MGDKIAARRLARELGVPTIPGTLEPVSGDDAARAAAREVGYPIMIKAAMGGGGKGMRLVRREEELMAALRMARSEAGSAFGDASVYLERAIEEPRHIEVQVLADGPGPVITSASASARSSAATRSSARKRRDRKSGGEGKRVGRRGGRWS